MTEWTKGNKPYQQGLYWVTVNKAGKIKIYDEPMLYKDGTWKLNGHNYKENTIITALLHLRRKMSDF